MGLFATHQQSERRMETQRRFTFVAQGLPEDTFTVVGFTGFEGLSTPYEFVINLASRRDDLGLDQLADGLCRLTMLQKDADLPFNGIVTRFEQRSAVKNLVFYRAVLAPRLWALTLTRHNRVFLDKSAPEFLKELLEQTGILTSRDYEFRLTGNYPRREFVCQWRESDYAFFARWLEREGMYYFFEQHDGGEKLIVTDSAISHQPLPGQPDLAYRQVQGMNLQTQDEFVHGFVCEERLSPKSVMIKDYNYRTPNVPIQASADVQQGDIGQVYIYGENVKSEEEARRQAQFFAEEARAGKKRCKGRSTAPFVRSGFTFTLRNHFRGDANQEYLTVSAKHEGQQTGYLITVYGRALAAQEAKNYYRNSFEAIPAAVQYRHPRQTPKPRFHGLINARIDASGSGQYASLDDKGRYKVRLPFDLANRPDGAASSWIRMAQPYGGANHGMHFPLLKGSEVLMAFIDGDVDRPVIAHAVPNYEQQSVVRDTNAPANAIRSAGGNQLVMGDKSGEEFIGLYSPFHKSGIAVGSMQAGGGGSISLSTEGDFDSFTAGANNSATFGASNEFTCGVTNDVFVGLKNELVAAISFSATLASQVEYVKGGAISLGDEGTDLKNTVDTTGLEKLTLSGGVAAPVTKLVSQAKTALALGMSGVAAAGVGITAMSAPFGDGFLKDASLDWKYPFYSGLAATVTGALMAACSAKTVQALVASYEAASELAKTSTIELDTNGIAATVNGLIGPGATFSAQVISAPACPDTLKSSFEIGAMGTSIELKNKGLASITMSNGTSIDLETTGATGKVSVSLGVDAVSMTVPAGGSVTANTQGVTMKSLAPGTGGSAETKPGSAKLACGANYLNITPTLVELGFAGVTFRAGPVVVNPAGMLALG